MKSWKKQVGVYLTLFLVVLGVTQLVVSEDADTVLAGIDYSVVYAWDSTSQLPLVHLPSGGGTFQDMATGQGYWIYSNEDTTLNLSGTEVAGVDRGEVLKVGWNLVGYESLTAADADTVFAGVDYSVVYAWNSGSQLPLVHLPSGGGTFQDMEAGQGYWIYVNTEVNWSY